MQLNAITRPSVATAIRRSRSVLPGARVHGPQTSTRIHTSSSLVCHVSSANQNTQTELATPRVPEDATSTGPCTKVGDVNWDLDWFHYTPWWYKPHYLILAGISFIIGCNLGTEPSIKTTLIAAAPVSVGWFIFLWMVPRQFADFAKKWIQTHPECEEHARQQQARDAHK